MKNTSGGSTRRIAVCTGEREMVEERVDHDGQADGRRPAAPAFVPAAFGEALPTIAHMAVATTLVTCQPRLSEGDGRAFELVPAGDVQDAANPVPMAKP